jgi:hypothetical protein
MNETIDNVKYIVTTEMGEKSENEVILGSYISLLEAKNAIDSHSRLVMNGQSNALSIYKIPMKQYLLYRFQSKNLKDAISKVKNQDYELESRSQPQNVPLDIKLKLRQEEIERERKIIPIESTQTIQTVQTMQPIQHLHFEPTTRSNASNAPNVPTRQQITYPQEVHTGSSRPSVIQLHMQRLQQVGRRR